MMTNQQETCIFIGFRFKRYFQLTKQLIVGDISHYLLSILNTNHLEQFMVKIERHLHLCLNYVTVCVCV